jgi:hypothetical protein
VKDGSLNLGASETEITAPWTLPYAEHLSASVRDLRAHKDAGKFTAKPSARVPSHDVVVVTVMS